MTTIELELPQEPTAARRARTAVHERFADQLAATVLYDVLTIVSELVTNGVRYGAPGPVLLRMETAADGTLVGAVENQGEADVRPREIGSADGSGLGLHIVAALSERWRADARDGRTVVRFEVKPV